MENNKSKIIKYAQTSPNRSVYARKPLTQQFKSLRPSTRRVGGLSKKTSTTAGTVCGVF